MDDKSKKTLGIALGGLAVVGAVFGIYKLTKNKPDDHICSTGYHWDGTACVLDVHTCPTGQHWDGMACIDDPIDPEEPITCATGYHPNEANTACVPDAQNTTPAEDVWAKANLVAFPLTSDQILKGITSLGVTIEGPSIEITDFHLTKVYPQAKVSVFPVDEWIAKIEAEDDNLMVEIAGDPCHMEDGQGHILPCVVGTRVGQLRGHTWGASLIIYEWDGEVWNRVFTGMLGPNQGWQTPLQYDLAEGLLTIKSSVDWPIPPGMVTYNIAVLPVGNWRSYCFPQSQYITEHLVANQPVSIPIILRAYGSQFSSYTPGTPMQFLSYVAQLRLDTAGCVMSYNSDWYDPPSTQQDYLTKEEMGIILNDGYISGIDTNITHTIISYSISMQELFSECLKIWRQAQWFWSWIVSFDWPIYNSWYGNVKLLASKNFIIDVTKYGDQ